MTAPGWYHAAGDPEGTTRYWDGSAWIGEATGQSGSGDVVYYAASHETEIDLGDVATRVTRTSGDLKNSYAVSPYSVSKAEVNVVRRAPLPEGLKSLVVLVCALKALALFLLVSSIRSIQGTNLTGTAIGRYAPPGMDLRSGAGALIVMLGVVAMGAALLFAHGRSAIRDQASMLLTTGLMLLLVDVLNSLNQFVDLANGSRARPTMLALLGLVLQGAVVLWALFQSQKKTLWTARDTSSTSID